jgi:hypothetical protein
MRFTSRSSGVGETNSRHSLRTRCSAVCGRASRMSSTASPSSLPLTPSTVLIPLSWAKGRQRNSPLAGSMLQPVKARAASLTSCSP